MTTVTRPALGFTLSSVHRVGGNLAGRREIRRPSGRVSSLLVCLLAAAAPALAQEARVRVLVEADGASLGGAQVRIGDTGALTDSTGPLPCGFRRASTS